MCICFYIYVSVNLYTCISIHLQTCLSIYVYIGSFLALDLGGTNFRVLKVVLKGKGKFDVHSSKHKVYLSPSTCTCT